MLFEEQDWTEGNAFTKTIFRPGINDREGTAYDNEGGWFDCNLVRFRKGRPEKFAMVGKN